MCEWGRTIPRRLPEFVQREVRRRNVVVDIDACMEPVVDALWAGGVVTRGVCCGHGDGNASVVVYQRDVVAAHEICAGRAGLVSFADTCSISSSFRRRRRRKNSRWGIERRLRVVLDRNPTPDEMFGADGRALGHVAPREPCAWCRADRYDRASGRCPRCNEPWYDGALAWPGPTTATLTPCALRFGGGSRNPSGHLSVARRVALHRGEHGVGKEWNR